MGYYPCATTERALAPDASGLRTIRRKLTRPAASDMIAPPGHKAAPSRQRKADVLPLPPLLPTESFVRLARAFAGESVLHGGSATEKEQ